jgi:uncharacterized membrane protein YdjX (TVP38/TMEM64 family)
MIVYSAVTTTCAICVARQATAASVAGFQLARTQLREKVSEEVQKRPALRAVERAVVKEG